jgi:outer membrane lipoprotein-sorting protein
MMKPLMILLGAVIAVTILSPAANAAQAPDAHAILAKQDDLWRGTSSKGKMTMNVKTSHWKRSLTMDVYSQGKDYSLVKVQQPLKEQGTATLKIKDEIYNYLPKTDRTVKLTSAMMMGSWMGSHFNNDDLVKESRLSEDYVPKVTFQGKKDGQEITEITLTPKPDAPVVWGKIITTVRAADWIPLKNTYYDEDGKVIRVLTCTDIKTVSGRVLPTRLVMTPLDKPGEYTEVIYDDLSFNVPFKKGFFSIAELRR